MQYKDNRGLFKYIILTPLTLGLYAIVFWCGYARDVNNMCDGDGKHTTNYIVTLLLTVITLGIYFLVWECKMQNRLRDRGNELGCGITQKGSSIIAWKTLGVLLFAIGPFVALHYQIQTINQVAIAINHSPVNRNMRSNTTAYQRGNDISRSQSQMPFTSTASISCPRCQLVQPSTQSICSRCGASLHILSGQNGAEMNSSQRTRPAATANSGAVLQMTDGSKDEHPNITRMRFDAIRCPRCNKELSAEKVICDNCGLYLNSEHRPSPAQQAHTQQASAAMNTTHWEHGQYPGPAAHGEMLQRRRRSQATNGEARDITNQTVTNIMQGGSQLVHPSAERAPLQNDHDMAYSQHNIGAQQQPAYDINAGVNKLLLALQKLPEPKPIYLWAAIAVACVTSIAALLVSIFR